jgi:hypothetical protein
VAGVAHPCSGAESAAKELIVFSKYVHHTAHDDDEDMQDDMPLLEVEGGQALRTALLCRRPLSAWNRLMYFLRLSKPVEGPQWIQVPVKSLTKRFVVDEGELRERPVNVIDCHAQTAVFVLPFIRLYQVPFEVHSTWAPSVSTH